jgi:D-alanyl-D-alanine carboxypeptidase/D-alanyl-D-alanine-endopeptidase (penicillin-binding protein 4)
MSRLAPAFALLLALAPVSATAAQDGSGQQSLQQRVEARLREAGPGTRFGLVVATDDGREIVAIAPDARFIPASNTKMFTTAAAFATLSGLDRPDTAGGASVRLETASGRAPDVVLEGHGDARLSSAAGCAVNCLATLADAVAARTRLVRDVIGDDSFFPDQRWSPGMSWNNIGTRSGTAASALSLDDNELHLRVSPTAPGRPPALDMLPYYVIDNRAVTSAAGATDLAFDRLPGSNVLRLTGTIAIGAEPELLRLGIDDPAHFAAWRFRALLEARGVRVTGAVAARHRPPGQAAAAARPEPLARLAAPPLAEDLVTINKASQNLHAELMLRRLGRQAGTGSMADGLAVVRAMLERAGLRRADYDFSDGSGMSTYNRLTPRGVVRFLRWAGAQPWGAAWRATLAVGGVDGTLARRFRGTALESRLFAKTGGLNATTALSGYLTARSGRTLHFSFYANDIPDGAAATPAMDAALLLIAEQN